METPPEGGVSDFVVKWILMARNIRAAFTLVELLMVIAIIGLLSTVAVVATSSTRSKAQLVASQDFEASVQRGVGADMIGEWLFDETSGTAAADTSGNGHNGTIAGATRVSGVSGNALSFVPGSYVSLGNDASLDPLNFTITAWVKPGDFSGPYNYIYSNARDCCGSYNGINFVISNYLLVGGIWNVAGGWPGGSQGVSSNARITNSASWTFVAFTFNGSKLALYINGHQDNTANSNYPVGQPASGSTYIGAMGVIPSLGMNGSIDQVRLYGSAIVAEGIRGIYLAERDKYLAER